MKAFIIIEFFKIGYDCSKTQVFPLSTKSYQNYSLLLDSRYTATPTFNRPKLKQETAVERMLVKEMQKSQKTFNSCFQVESGKYISRTIRLPKRLRKPGKTKVTKGSIHEKDSMKDYLTSSSTHRLQKPNLHRFMKFLKLQKAKSTNIQFTLSFENTLNTFLISLTVLSSSMLSSSARKPSQFLYAGSSDRLRSKIIRYFSPYKIKFSYSPGRDQSCRFIVFAEVAFILL